MRSIRRAAVLAIVLIASTSTAQIPPFGKPFPLTNTHYSGVREYTSWAFAPYTPILRTNGRDAFLFQFTEYRLQVARIVEGERRIPQLVFPFQVSADYDFDAVWTGSHFLVVAKNREDGYRMYGRLVDAIGAPLGEPFQIGDLSGTWPRLAFNGRHVLLVYAAGLDAAAVTLTPEGGLTDFAPQELLQGMQMPPVVTSSGSRFAAILPGSDFDTLCIFDENGRVSVQRTVDSVGWGWAIASDGERFLAVNMLGDARVMLFNADGSTAASLLLDEGEANFYRSPLVTWAGSRWIISAVVSNEGHVIEMDSAAQEILSTRTVPNTQVGIVARGDHILALWWSNGELLAHELPFGTEPGRVVARQAAHQDLLAGVSSANATLVLWLEDALRAGIRTSDGQWKETILGSLPEQTLLAATDGDEFVVIGNTDVLHVNVEGEVTSRVTAPFLPLAIAWNGAHYGLIGWLDGSLVASVLTSSGLAEPVRLPSVSGLVMWPYLASDGDGFFAVWGSRTEECSEWCPATRLHGLRLTEAMAPAGSMVTLIEGPSIQTYGVAWDGERFLIAHNSDRSIRTAEPEPGGGTRNERVLAEGWTDSIDITPSPSGVAIGWREDELTYRAAWVDRGGNPSAPVTIHQEPDPSLLWLSRLIALGDGRLAYLYSSAQNATPHYGSRRVMMSIADTVIAQVPDAPRVSLSNTAGVATLSWTRPDGSVHGFRVEQRIGDDAWMEIDRWFDAEQRTLSLTASDETRIAFRVRAFNDAGPGRRSAPVRRRAIR